MEQTDILRHAVDALEQLGVPYLVVGSYASIAYGELRVTQDIDIVIDPTSSALDAFLATLAPADYYMSKEAAYEASSKSTG